MNASEALTILRPVAEGIDPGTGEAYPDTSPLQRAPLVRALIVAVSALEADEERARRRERLPANTGVPWSEKEDAELGRAFDEGGTIERLAATHKRTVGAIRARLLMLGRMTAADQ